MESLGILGGGCQRIEVNRFDGRGWRSWGCGHAFDAATADGLIDFMRPEPERRELEAAGLAVPGKLFRRVPACAVEQDQGAA